MTSISVKDAAGATQSLPVTVPGTAGSPSIDVLTVQGADTATPVAVGGKTVSVSASLTRPANTTAYTALDTISDSTSTPTVLTLSNVARINGGGGYITKARLMTDQSTNVARFRVHLFHTAPTAINDNDPFPMLWANRANRIGHIDFEPMQTEGTGSTAANTSNITTRLAFVCAAADRNIYALLETRDGFTPISGQNFYLELTAELN